MKVVSAAEMRELDRNAIEDYGIPGVILMENAGNQVVQVIRQFLPNIENKSVCVFSGKGNNGGKALFLSCKTLITNRFLMIPKISQFFLKKRLR